jgi:hypothetical protein
LQACSQDNIKWARIAFLNQFIRTFRRCFQEQRIDARRALVPAREINRGLNGMMIRRRASLGRDMGQPSSGGVGLAPSARHCCLLVLGFAFIMPTFTLFFRVPDRQHIILYGSAVLACIGAFLHTWWKTLIFQHRPAQKVPCRHRGAPKLVKNISGANRPHAAVV